MSHEPLKLSLVLAMQFAAPRGVGFRDNLQMRFAILRLQRLLPATACWIDRAYPDFTD